MVTIWYGQGKLLGKPALSLPFIMWVLAGWSIRVPTQMVVLASRGGFAPVAPMLFTSQLTLSFLVTRNDRRDTRKPFSFSNHPQLCNGLNPQPRGQHFWGNS